MNEARLAESHGMAAPVTLQGKQFKGWNYRVVARVVDGETEHGIHDVLT